MILAHYLALVTGLTTAGDVRVSVDIHDVIGPISPYIYGTNLEPKRTTNGNRFSMFRLGGNRWSTYNWETNASNAGRDWHHQNDGYLSESEEPAEAILAAARSAWKRGQPVLATIPIGPYLAADRLGNGDVQRSGPEFLDSRFRRNHPGTKRVGRQPNPSDNQVSQSECVAYLRRRPTNKQLLWFSLDNEPDLWHETHPRIHPQRANRRQLVERSLSFARAIKETAPESLIFGPAVSGWMGMTRFGDPHQPNQEDFLETYLRGFADAERQTGKRFLDCLDVHWYPEHQGGNTRVTSDASTDAVAKARVDAVRSLYDPEFVENSWITRDVLKSPINLLPRLKSIIDRHYPGTKLAITEYYFGGGEDVSGAMAQADLLGAMGAHGVFCACLFHMGKTDDRFIHAAFDLFRNCDGRGSGFGDTAVRVQADPPRRLRVYAATQNNRVLTVVAINPDSEPCRVNWTFPQISPTGSRAFQITSHAPRPIAVPMAEVGSKSSPMTLLPSRSVTLILWNIEK